MKEGCDTQHLPLLRFEGCGRFKPIEVWELVRHVGSGLICTCQQLWNLSAIINCSIVSCLNNYSVQNKLTTIFSNPIHVHCYQWIILFCLIVIFNFSLDFVSLGSKCYQCQNKWCFMICSKITVLILFCVVCVQLQSRHTGYTITSKIYSNLTSKARHELVNTSQRPLMIV